MEDDGEPQPRSLLQAALSALTLASTFPSAESGARVLCGMDLVNLMGHYQNGANSVPKEKRKPNPLIYKLTNQ